MFAEFRGMTRELGGVETEHLPFIQMVQQRSNTYLSFDTCGRVRRLRDTFA